MANIIKPKRSSTSSSAPTTSDLADGEIAVNTADQKIYMRSGSNIVTVGNAGSGIDNVVEDTSPQLGGNLDLNSNNITGTGDITTTGDLVLTDTTADSAAGPEFEFYRNSSSPADGDYLGQIKFQGENDADQKVLYAKITGKISDASDTTEDGLIEYAVRKAGSNAIVARLTGTALKLINSTGLEVAGNITVDGTVDGRDVATDGTKLDGIEASADVTDTTNVVAALTAGTNVTIAANGTISSTDTNTTYSVGDGGLTQNNFTDALKTKLDGIEASATNTADPAITTDGSTPTLASGITAAEVRTLIGAGTSSSDNATHTGEVVGATSLTVASNVIDADNLKVTGNGTTSQFLRSDGDGTFTWATPTDTDTTYSVGDGGLTENNFTDALKTKLDGIEASADVTPSWVPSSDPSYITGLTLDNLTGKDAGTGDYTTSGDLVSGRSSGGVALTINDGYGNANVTFNHRNGTPEQNGQSARIEVNTDATSNEATMYFEFSASDVTANTAVGLATGMTLAHDYVEIPNKIRHAGDNDTYIQFDTDRIRLYAGDTAKIDTDVDYWHAGNDGSGSGLDADTLDGIDSTSFLRSDANDTATGALTIGNAIYGNYTGSATDITGLIGGSAFGSLIQSNNNAHHVIGIRDNDVNDSFAVISGSGNYTTDTTYDKLVFQAKADGTLTANGGNTIWHAGNDGADSGLDADLLDGAQGSLYARLASPTFTGTPAAPTASAGTNTTQLATTAFVTTAVSSSGGISNVVEDTSPELGGDLDLNSNNIVGTGGIEITGQLKSTGNHVTTSGLANFTSNSTGFRQYNAQASSGGGTFLLGKIRHGSSNDGGISGVVYFGYDYGSSTDNVNLHFTFAQRSGTVRGHWWYENTDDDSGGDNVKIQVIDDGSGGVYIWLVLGDYGTCSVECWWRQTNMVGKSSGAGIAGSLSSETITSGTTSFDTSNDPTAEMHIGKLYSHSTIHGTLNSDVTASTQSTNDNSTKVATTAYVKQEIDALKALLYAYDQS